MKINPHQQPFLTEPRGWLFYDGDCAFCVKLTHKFQHFLYSRAYGSMPLQSPWALNHLPQDHQLDEMKVLTPNQHLLGGADAILYLTKEFWWSWPLSLLSHIPGFLPLARWLYHQVSSRRHCLNGACQKPEPQARSSNKYALGLLFALPILTAIVFSNRPAWLLMWALAISIYVGLKILTLNPGRESLPDFSTGHILSYLFLWPGMSFKNFVTQETNKNKYSSPSLIVSLLNIWIGVSLIWGIVRYIPNHLPLIQGWVGMVGLILILHFGVFQVLSIIWQSLGFNVEPLMKSPILSQSVTEFWGQRWNSAFRQISYDLIFKSLRNKISPWAAMALVFFTSGLIHDLVISYPARTGYGLPTLYFSIQFLGIIFEKSKAGKWLGLGHGLRGWTFTFAVTAAPAIILFHPAFVKNVILPFMQALGALS